MTNRKNPAGESGYSKSFAFTATAIAICSLIIGAAVLAPAGAASDISTTADYADSSNAFPDQFVNQPEQVMLMMYYLDD
jgi:hypothetical protein